MSDVHVWAQNCKDHLYLSHFFNEQVGRISDVVKYVEPKFKPLDIRGIVRKQEAKTIGFFNQKMEECANNRDNCKEQILLDHYYIGLLTKNDAKMKDFINSVADGVEAYIIGVKKQASRYVY